MADIPVVVAKDPVKERLRAIKAKLNSPGVAGKKLTPQEIEDTLADILKHLEIN